MLLKINLCRPGAKMPAYATQGAACFDIYAANDKPYMVEHGAPVIVPTGLKFDIPEGWALMVYSRSGHGFKFDVRLANGTGVIDSDYTDEVMVKLTQDPDLKYGSASLRVHPGDRIAQAMLIKAPQLKLVETDEAPQQKGNRTGGFGSTGK